MQKIKQQAAALLPGFLACLGIALVAQLAAQFIPLVGAALIAIALGMLAGNTFFNRPGLDVGTKFSESRLLEYSIVMMGLTLNLGDIIGVGWRGVLFIALQMTLTVTAAYLIGKRLGFGKRFSLLMCAGNAVCGSSAIGTITPIVKADAKEKGISITIVNVTGTFLMVTLPLLAAALYQGETLRTSGLIGGVLQSIGQVIASAKLVSSEVVDMAAIFKIIRIIFLVAVALLFSRMNTEDGQGLFAKKNGGDKAAVKVGVPWFIIGFFICSVIATLRFLPGELPAAAKTVSNQFEIIALAAIGMRVKFSVLVKEGPKALLYGGMVGLCQVIFAVTLIAIIL